MHRLIRGNVLDGLRSLPSDSVDCIVTSPPYWGLRDYGLPHTVWGGDPDCKHRWQSRKVYREGGASSSSAERYHEAGESNIARLKKTRWRDDVTCKKCGAWKGCLGLEPTVEMFTAHLLMVMAECQRVLKPSGTCWVNMGDGFNAYNSNRGRSFSEYEERVIRGRDGRGAPTHSPGLTDPGLKVKDRIGQPWRVALAMQGFAVVPFRRFSEWADDLRAAREAGDWEAVRIVEERLRACDLIDRLGTQGWWLRQDVIWAKPSAMPESATDRCTQAHEYIFMLTKRARYWYDAEAIKTPVKDASLVRMAHPTAPLTFQDSAKYNKVPRKRGRRTQTTSERLIRQHAASQEGRQDNWEAIKNGVTGANARSVWEFASEGSTCGACEACGRVWAMSAPDVCPCGAEITGHYAAFPTELPKRCILAGCPEEVCAECGAPYERVLEKGGGTTGASWHDHADDLKLGMTKASTRKKDRGKGKEPYRCATAGWRPTCKCGTADTRPGIVLDPFAGTCTTLKIAVELGREAWGCELNPLYADLGEARLSLVTPSLFART